MRAPTTVLKAGLSAAAAVVLLTACGGSDGDSNAAASTTAGSTASSSGAPPTGTPDNAGDTATFCSQALALSSNLTQALTAASSDPAAVAPVLQQAADQYAGVQPPAEIAQDWDLVAGAIQTLATAAQGIDFTVPGAGDQLAASISGQQSQLSTATTNVENYATTNCPAPSAAPTS